MKNPSDPNTTWTVIVGIIGALVLLIFIVGIQTMFYQVENAEIQAKVVSQAPEQLASLRAEQETNLNSYRTLDPVAGLVAIPIDQAMELVVQDYKETGSEQPVVRTAGNNAL